MIKKEPKRFQFQRGEWYTDTDNRVHWRPEKARQVKPPQNEFDKEDGQLVDEAEL